MFEYKKKILLCTTQVSSFFFFFFILFTFNIILLFEVVGGRMSVGWSVKFKAVNQLGFC
jgi:hypothetical protein